MLDLLADPVIDVLHERLGGERADLARLLGPPTRADAGDLTLPCFIPAKALGLPPPRLAQELAALLGERLPGLEASAVGPFLNISFAPELVAGQLLPGLIREPLAALRSTAGSGRTVVIDFSSPNIAKHLAFHHIRSTMLGNALSHCYAAAGWQVRRVNFLGDWGTAFGRLIAGWMAEGLQLADLEASADKVGFLNALYVRVSQAAKDDPAVAEAARRWSKALEDGDAQARELWQVFKDASLAEFRTVYALLGVDFDSWKGEAHYQDRMAPVVEELTARGLLAEDQGAQVVDLSDLGFAKPCLIRRADGGSLYATRDLAACDDRFAEYAFDRALYVVDLGQSLHFREWFAVADKLGRPYAERLRHVGFGVLLIWNDEEQAWAKGRTRNGVPMLLVEVLRESIERADLIIADKNPELELAERRAVAEAVGIGAVVFNDLKNHRKGDVKFRFEDALAMQGDTGPYLQYAHARLCSIARKASVAVAEADPALLTRADEKQVLLRLARLRRALEAVVADDDPSQLATALLDLAGALSAWLSAGNRDPGARVLVEDAPLRASRLALVEAARSCLGEGLRLLGLRAPERM